MTPADIDRVFGRGRLRMVTGEHVEVFREASLPGERRRYTKRFLATAAGDFRHWTEREWRILARLVGHGIGPVPDVVQFDRGAADRPALVQTYDAGITVDHWATLLPVQRDGALLRHVFEDCAHWWALARHCLIALDAIHELQLVHLDLKADNVCIPFGPADFDPQAGQLLAPRFEQIALIDFAFSLVSGESLTRALPIARQTDYDYQSPRLLQALDAGSCGDLMPTRQLDWRCDVFSLAAMLRRYLPDPEAAPGGGWTGARQAQARALVRRLLEAHDGERPAQRPHAELIGLTTQALADAELADALTRGWTLAIDSEVAGDASPTPVTRIALPVSADVLSNPPAIARLDQAKQDRVRARRWTWSAAAVSMAAIGAPLLYDAWSAAPERAATDTRPAMPAAAVAAPTAVLARAPTPAPEAAPARASRDVTAAEAAPTAASEPALTAAPAAPVPAPEVAPEAAAPVAAPAPAFVPAPAPLAATAPLPAPATAAARVPARSRERVAASALRPAAAAKAKPAATAAAAVTARAPARPAARPTAVTAAPQSGRERALAWLTLRGPAPRSAMSPGASAWPAVAQLPAPAVVPAASVASAAMPVAATAPARTAIALPTPMPAPVQAVATQPALPPTPAPRDFAARAHELMASDLPRVAQRAERRVLRAMSLAEQPDSAWQDDDIRRAASAIRDTTDLPLPAAPGAVDEARVLHEAARVAFWRRGNAREAFDLESRAFGANPLDADIVGSLALLSLKQGAPQAGLARELALYALGLQDARYPGGRIEDWTTLAIASALAGRDRDARNAWFVSLALAPQPERQCRAAVNAYALHGERLRAAVEAMLYRAHSSGRAEGSALCEWPPHWMANGRAR